MPILNFPRYWLIIIYRVSCICRYKFSYELLGHDSIQITADVYACIPKKIEEKSMNEYEEYIIKIVE